MHPTAGVTPVEATKSTRLNRCLALRATQLVAVLALLRRRHEVSRPVDKKLMTKRTRIERCFVRRSSTWCDLVLDHEIAGRC